MPKAKKNTKSASRSDSSISGGIEINSDEVDVRGDVIGRDKSIESKIFIERVEHYHAVESSPPSPSPAASTRPLSTLPSDPVPLIRGSGSPFVVGRPLRAEEPVFGRESAFRFIAGELAKFSSVNIVGERRMGKSSLINHLLGHPDQYLIAQPDQPRLSLARVDLQSNVSDAIQFYGTALRSLLSHLPSSRGDEARELQRLLERLNEKCEASYAEFNRVLHQLRDAHGPQVRPVLVIDEFESLLDVRVKDSFPFPMFYNGLRSLMTEGVLAMVVASRLSLTDHFNSLPTSLTSTFPTYFTHFSLKPLDDTAADALLLQDSDYPLGLLEARQSREWTKGHPCQLQAAGQAWYETKAGTNTAKWAHDRFIELRNHSCMVGRDTQPLRRGWVRRALRN